MKLGHTAVLEITVSHWPFFDQFQHLADQNPFWSAIFPVHFQWNSNQLPIKKFYLQNTADQFMILIFSTALCGGCPLIMAMENFWDCTFFQPLRNGLICKMKDNEFLRHIGNIMCTTNTTKCCIYVLYEWYIWQ